MDKVETKARIGDLMQELEYRQFEQWLAKRNAGEIVWNTKDGKGIPISQMPDSHLKNAIKLYERQMQKRKELAEAACDFDW